MSFYIEPLPVRFALGAVFIYQLALLPRYKQGSKTNRGLKAFLRPLEEL